MSDQWQGTLRDEPESWPVVSSEDRHRDGWVMAFRRDVIHRPGEPEPTFARLVLEHPGAAVVLALDEQDRVLVLHQYRHPARRRFVELPAGLLDAPGEDPLEAARRELREEAGLAADTWAPLLSTYASPGISEEIHHYFLATDLREVDRGDFEPHAEELDLRPEWVPLAALREAVLAGDVRDAPVALAVLALEARRREGGGAGNVPDAM